MFGKQAIRLWAPVAQQARNRGVSTIAGPPQNHVSFGEMLVTGVVMTCGMLAIPAWVMAHIKEYKGQE